MTSNHRHKCTRCGRCRSKRFHQEFPAGPGHPQVEGVCRRCLSLPPDNPVLHIHYHHWLHPPRLSPGVPQDDHQEVSQPSPQHAGCPRSPLLSDPPPEYAEYPAHQDNFQDRRVELTADQGDSIHNTRAELPAHEENNIQSGRAELPTRPHNNGRRAIFIDYCQDEQPPPVGLKPSLSRFIHRLNSLLD